MRAKTYFCSAAILLSSCFVVPPTWCQGADGTDSAKLSFGLRISDIQQFHELSKIGEARVTELKFVANDRLALGMYFSSIPDPNAGQDFRVTVHSNAAIALLDAQSGKTTRFKAWTGLEGEPVVSGKLKILPIGRGNFIVGVQDTLFRFSPDFGLQAERRLRPKGAGKNDGLHEDYWSIDADPQGRSALLIRSTNRLTEQVVWISPLTLADEQKLDELPRYVHSLTTLVDRALVSNWNYLDTAPHPIMVEERGAPPRALCSECMGAVSSTFGKDLIFIAKSPGASYMVADLAGNVILRGSHPGKQVSLAASSGGADSNRAAIDYFDGNFPKAGTLYFAVVDVDAKNEIWRHEREGTIVKGEVGGFHTDSFTPPKIALSPDGHRLAILTNGLLQVYPIP